MPAASKPVYRAEVRELVEFALRQGDLGGQHDFVGPRRALAGTRGHQRLQRSRPAGYQKEVQLGFDVETAELILRIRGRIDGLLVTPGQVLLEEIKTVQSGWDGIAYPLHWGQAKVYGCFYAREHALEQVVIQLTYLNLDTGALTEFQERFSLSELTAFFEKTAAIYLEWLQAHQRWRRLRDASARALSFPFARYRPGQRRLAVAAYRTLARGGRLFLEAPTGIGKTVSVLFPAVKALGEGKLERVFYLTARTSGRAVAQETLTELRQAGLSLRFVTLTAKEKVCFQEGQACDPLACPFARGYYDRNKAAMRDTLSHEAITRPVLEAAARNHQVCPFELSLDLSTWVDVVVCDYNYVFDPRVYLRRHFAEEPGDYAFLVDEAHNLVDRARDMFSADLDAREIRDVRRALKEAVPRCARALSRLTSAMRKLCPPEPDTLHEPGENPPGLPAEGLFPLTPALSRGEMENQGRSRELTKRVGSTSAALRGLPVPKGEGEARGPGINASASPERGAGVRPAFPRITRTTREFPTHLRSPLEAALKEAETWLARNQPADFRESLLELYFRLRAFQRTAELYDERFVTIVEPGSAPRVRLFCLDPSCLLGQALARGKAATFFSATLTPIDYYRTLLGGTPEDPLLQLASPFPPEHQAVLVHDRIRTQLKARAETLADVVQAIACFVGERPGNYLAYFPSYQYLAAVHEQFQALCPDVPILVQRPSMSEPEREAFLAAFAAERRDTLIGFAVMGGVFGEGIDLVGDRLIGAAIVGVGLPQLCIERDLIRDYFQRRTGSGFDYAYTFPGMNRVLQATGRVIRSEADRGAVLLIDVRFSEPRYRRLFPPWWHPARVRSLSDIREVLQPFWRP